MIYCESYEMMSTHVVVKGFHLLCSRRLKMSSALYGHALTFTAARIMCSLVAVQPLCPTFVLVWPLDHNHWLCRPFSVRSGDKIAP